MGPTAKEKIPIYFQRIQFNDNVNQDKINLSLEHWSITHNVIQEQPRWSPHGEISFKHTDMLIILFNTIY